MSNSRLYFNIKYYPLKKCTSDSDCGYNIGITHSQKTYCSIPQGETKGVCCPIGTFWNPNKGKCDPSNDCSDYTKAKYGARYVFRAEPNPPFNYPKACCRKLKNDESGYADYECYPLHYCLANGNPETEGIDAIGRKPYFGYGKTGYACVGYEGSSKCYGNPVCGGSHWEAMKLLP